jgi:AraC-like DNA-binding protein
MLGVRAGRLHIDRADGDGSYELYPIGPDLFVLVIDCLFDKAREEIALGEDLLEIHICLQGQLTMHLPLRVEPVVARGPCSLLLYQPRGADLREHQETGLRYTGVSIYCGLRFLRNLLVRSGIRDCPMMTQLESTKSPNIWHEKQALNPTLRAAAMSLLRSRYDDGIRLLYAEARALDLLCEVLTGASSAANDANVIEPPYLVKQIDSVRRMLSTQLGPLPQMSELARRAGMSESKLHRAFKQHYGMTVFEYSRECRMRSALNLLRSGPSSICEVAALVGYQHQTSFTAAFRDHFGFLPSEARSGRTPSPKPSR